MASDQSDQAGVSSPSDQPLPDPSSCTVDGQHAHNTKTRKKGKASQRNAAAGCAYCLHTFYWLIGCVCFAWWIVLVLYRSLSSVSEALSGSMPVWPGDTLRKQGLRARHPVVFVPGTVTGGLELWEGLPCANGLFRKRLWGGTFGKVYKRPHCWLQHMALDNETGLDPAGIRVRSVSGLVAADYFAPGYFVWAVLIENLARIGYEEKSMHMAAYDWRLAFQNTEVRDRTLSRLKSSIELLVQTNSGNKAVVIAHSMGSLYFLHFMKWVEAPSPMGGNGGPDWCAKHIKAVMNVGGPFLGVPKAVTALFSTEAKDVAMARDAVPEVMRPEHVAVQALQHIMQVTRTWDSTISMLLKGGETIWGGLDWSPEEGYDCSIGRKHANAGNDDEHNNSQNSNAKDFGSHGKPMAHYGRIISVGKNAAEVHALKLKTGPLPEKRSGDDSICKNVSCGTVWTEYHEMTWESVEAVAEQVYTAGRIPELLRFVAPQMMLRGDSQFSHGIADDLSDPKYEHFKYWSNPLETRLPNAPEMEIYCMYGVGILTERSYIYKVSANSEMGHIPFRIDTLADGDSEGCLKGGVQFVDGDETVPVLSAGFMCAKGWRGRTRFNPAGSATCVREYELVSPNSFLEGRGSHSALHVDIMGNFALIQDIMRVAAGQDIGGDRILSDLLKWADRIPLQLDL